MSSASFYRGFSITDQYGIEKLAEELFINFWIATIHNVQRKDCSMNAKDNFLETLRWGNPDALVNEWEPFGFVFDPLMAVTLVAQPGETVVDGWGVHIYWGEGEPGAMPIINDEQKAIKDITRWREDIQSPDLLVELDWSDAVQAQNEVRAAEKLSVSLMPTGLFELSHYLMGFEDFFINIMTEQDDMHELLDYLTDFKMTYLELLVKNLKPDVVLWHDDWGSKLNLFVSPDIWREFFKPRYEKLFSFLHDNGVIVMVHADSFLEPIIQDMIDVHIDVWQGAIPENNIPEIQKITKGKMLLMGGLDASLVDVADYDEETIRAEVRRACDEYVPGGGFIPCLTYGAEGSIFPGVNDIIMDEIKAISPKYF